MIHVPRPAYREQVMQWTTPQDLGASAQQVVNGQPMNVRTQGSIEHNELGVSVKSDGFGFVLRDPGLYSYNGNVTLKAGAGISRDGQVGIIVSTTASNASNLTYYASRTASIDVPGLQQSIFLLSPDFIFPNAGGEFTFSFRHINNRDILLSAPSYIEIVRHD